MEWRSCEASLCQRSLMSLCCYHSYTMFYSSAGVNSIPHLSSEKASSSLCTKSDSFQNDCRGFERRNVLQKVTWWCDLIPGQHDCGDPQHPNRSLSMNQSATYLQVWTRDPHHLHIRRSSYQSSQDGLFEKQHADQQTGCGLTWGHWLCFQGAESGVWALHTCGSGVDHPNGPRIGVKVTWLQWCEERNASPWRNQVSDVGNVLSDVQAAGRGPPCSCDGRLWDLSAGIHSSQNALHLPPSQGLRHSWQ